MGNGDWDVGASNLVSPRTPVLASSPRPDFTSRRTHPHLDTRLPTLIFDRVARRSEELLLVHGGEPYSGAPLVGIGGQLRLVKVPIQAQQPVP